MTGSEALGMLLGKEIYDSVKNKINNTSIQTNKNFILNILHLNNKGYDKVLNINN